VSKHFPRWALFFALGAFVLGQTEAAWAASPRSKGATHSGRRTRGHASAKKKIFLERHVASMKGGLPNVQAQGALVIDTDSGREIFSRNPDKERPIASISKLAATLVVADRGLELDGLTTIEKGDLDVARGGARSRLLEGMTLSNRDLLHAALMGSDNRAIPALGRAVKLAPTQLAAAMTARARELGLKNTRFRDPTGLSTENVSTPRETIVLLRAVMNHPVLGPITRRLEYDAHPVGRPAITYTNTYRPALRGNIQVLGGKTGYNDDARYCLVLAAKIDGHTYCMSFLANEGKMTRFGDVARVADWVIAHRSTKPAGTAVASSDKTSAAATAMGAALLPVGVAAPPPEAAASGGSAAPAAVPAAAPGGAVP
jgi:D-alanyl-D-alanine endopeptidase (penicillin-binding protein 7)